MLNTDFELFFDVQLDGDGKAVCILDNNCVAKKTCGINGICPIAETYDQAATYAQVNITHFKSLTNNLKVFMPLFVNQQMFVYREAVLRSSLF